MVSFAPPFFQPPSRPMKDASGGEAFPLSKGIGSDGIMSTAAMPASRDVLAFVPPVPGSERTVLDILSRILPGAAGQLLSGILSKVSPLLFVLNTSDTADTTQMQALVRRLEAEGINPRNVSFGMLPNGDLGVYRRDPRDPDDPFPELLAIIKPDGTIVTQAPAERPATGLIPDGFNPLPPIVQGGTPPNNPPNDPPPRAGPANPTSPVYIPETPDDGTEPQFPQSEVPRTDPNVLSPEARAKIDSLNAQRLKLKERIAELENESNRLGDAIAQMEAAQSRIAEQGRLRQESRNIITGLEREISGGNLRIELGGRLMNPQQIAALAAAVFAKAAEFEAEGEYEKALALIEAFLDRYEAHADEIPGSTPLHGGSAQKDDALERIQEAFEAARRIVLEPGGFFGDGVDPRDEMYRRFGYIGLFAYDVVNAERAVQDGTGGTSTAAGPSSAVARYLSLLPAETAALIVNHLEDRLDSVPEMYRDALARALENGDPESPAIARARQLLSEAGAAADARPALTPAESRIVEREIAAGTFSREVFEAFREANPEMSVVELVIELSMLMQGYDSKLTIPDIFSQTSEAGPAVNTYVYGTDEALDARTIEELDRLIALGESGVPLDPRTEAAAMIADQIRKNLDTADHALVMADAEGRPVGMMVYTYYPNPDDPTGPRVLFIEDIVSFAPGQGIGLKLLQEAFDRSEGILDLISLPGALDYYLGMGAQIVPPDPDSPFGANFYPHLRWTDRPERQEP